MKLLAQLAVRLLLAGVVAVPLSVGAEDLKSLEVGIRPDMPNVIFQTPAGEIRIERNQDQEHVIEGAFARTSRPCPPFCIQPFSVAEGVSTVGELELLQMLKDGSAVVVDSRTLEWYLEGTIPGAVHIPYTEIAQRLDELGCSGESGNWNCDNSKPVALFCNGPWCGQSPTGIRAMIREGYPAEHISYYRGGMQVWQLLGLTVVEGEF